MHAALSTLRDQATARAENARARCEEAKRRGDPTDPFEEAVRILEQAQERADQLVERLRTETDRLRTLDAPRLGVDRLRTASSRPLHPCADVRRCRCVAEPRHTPFLWR